jgi:hypothetical protein
MIKGMKFTAALVALLAAGASVRAQQLPAEAEKQGQPPLVEAQEKLDDITAQVNQSEQAQKVWAGILKPIYSWPRRFRSPPSTGWHLPSWWPASSVSLCN